MFCSLCRGPRVCSYGMEAVEAMGFQRVPVIKKLSVIYSNMQFLT